MTAARESWRYVRRDSRYKVSSLGRVRSMPRRLADGRMHGGQLLTPAPDKDGYLRVKLGARQVAVHVLVLEAWHGECPEGMEGCHGRLGQQVNTPGNLRWDTHAANERDKREFAAARAGAEGRIGTIGPEAERPVPLVVTVASGAAGG